MSCSERAAWARVRSVLCRDKFNWFAKAAHDGNPVAQYHLGNACLVLLAPPCLFDVYVLLCGMRSGRQR